MCADARRLLEESDERDSWLRRVLEAERRGYDRGVSSMADEYAHGWADGILARKRAEHEIVDEIRLEIARWGPGGREHFADPRPDDFRGLPTSAGPARIWLGGPPVHYHACNAACRAIRADRPYTPAEAAAILAGLPGNYAGTIASLRALSAQESEAAA
jgi:hypothetical protein